MRNETKHQHRVDRPRQYIGAMALLAALAVVSPAAAAAGEVLRGQLLRAEAEVPTLGYSLYLPDAVAEGAEGLPVVYLLHGFGGSDAEWLWGGDLAATLNRMIADGTVAPMIAVLPDARKSWYVDSARRGGDQLFASSSQVRGRRRAA